MYIPKEPRFRPQWLRPRLRQLSHPGWIEDTKWIPAGERMLYKAARHGLYAALLSIATSESQRALLPGYIPKSVVNAFREAGFDLVFYDIDPDLRIRKEELADMLITFEPEVVLFVQYFGFCDPSFDRLTSLASDLDTVVVEDCARALFSKGQPGEPLGATGDISIFSLHKVLPVPNGGMVITKGSELPSPSTSASEFRDLFNSTAQTICEWTGINPVRILDNSGSNSGETSNEFSSGLDALRHPGPITYLGLNNCQPEAIYSTRRSLYTDLRTQLVAVDGIDVLTPPLEPGTCPYGVVVRVNGGRQHRDRLFEVLQYGGYPVERLQWKYQRYNHRRDLSGTEVVRRSTLVIPTHQHLPDAILPEIGNVIEQTCEKSA